MNDELFSWVIIAEICLPFIILSIVLITTLIRARSKNKEAVRKLILQIKNNEDNQKQKLQTFLNEKVGADEKIIKKMSKKILNERKFLFRNLISGILDKNTVAITGLEEDLSRITDHYHSLGFAKQAEKPELVSHESNDEDKGKIDELKKEIKGLKHEVHVTLTTLNNIFGEFSSMFGEEVPDRELSVDQIITAMEAFATKSEVEESSANESEIKADELEELDIFAEMDEEIEKEEKQDLEQDISLEQEVINDTNELEPDFDKFEAVEPEVEDDELDFSIDSELDDIDSALDDLELGASPDEDFEDEPSWDDAFDESGDKK